MAIRAVLYIVMSLFGRNQEIVKNLCLDLPVCQYNKSSWFVLSWTQFPTCSHQHFNKMQEIIIFSVSCFTTLSYFVIHTALGRHCCGKFPKSLDFTVLSFCQLEEEIPEGRKSAAGSKDFMFHRI